MMNSKIWGLLMAPLGILLLGLGVLFLKQHPTGEFPLDQVMGELSYLPWLLAVIVLAAFVQALLLHSRPKPNAWLFPCVMMLASLGIIMIARLKPDLLVPQLRWIIIGMFAFILMLRLGSFIDRLTQYQYIVGIACLILLCLPLFFGTEIGGSRNWLLLGPFRVQPSEFGKILLVFFLSAYLTDHRQVLSMPNFRLLFLRLPPARFIAPLLVVWGVAVLMFVVQKDLGSALLFFGIAVLMTYMATGNKSYVFLALAFFGAAAAISYMMFGHVRVRFDIWWDPWKDPSGMAYQIVQSLFAFGSGGVWGTGFSYGHPGLIPEVHT
ncbi:MAG: FtsW/RodA/SpoVE family cell cycle protein, partial [Selenomonadaceae bacterium]|nr:FtsW/RodA/SpoVE family cell cycle protein [Selenomonadaceae bacterium]